jgi:hypothetical protein
MAEMAERAEGSIDPAAFFLSAFCAFSALSAFYIFRHHARPP